MEESTPTTEYQLKLYGKQFLGMVGVSLAFGGLGVALAISNKKGLILFRLIKLSPEEACWFFWAITAFFLGVIFPCSLLMGWKGLVAHQRIAFHADGLLLPRSFFSRVHIVVPYSDLVGVRELTRAYSRIIELQLRDRIFCIDAKWLESEAQFSEILALLRSVESMRSQRPPDN